MFRKPWYCAEGSTGRATSNIISTFDLIYKEGKRVKQITRMTVFCNFDTVYFCGLAPTFRRNPPTWRLK